MFPFLLLSCFFHRLNTFLFKNGSFFLSLSMFILQNFLSNKRAIVDAGEKNGEQFCLPAGYYVVWLAKCLIVGLIPRNLQNIYPALNWLCMCFIFELLKRVCKYIWGPQIRAVFVHCFRMKFQLILNNPIFRMLLAEWSHITKRYS